MITRAGNKTDAIQCWIIKTYLIKQFLTHSLAESLLKKTALSFVIKLFTVHRKFSRIAISPFVFKK